MSNKVPVRLIALRCVDCNTPIPANNDEIAWVCQNCQTAQLLDDEQGLQKTEIFYHADLTPTKAGLPCWVFEGTVTLDRDTYSMRSRDRQAEEFWKNPRTFYIPAYTCDLDHLINKTSWLLENPLPLKSGPASHFESVTLHQEDIQAVAEYVIMGIEAHRKDDVKVVNFNLKMAPPQLWIIPAK